MASATLAARATALQRLRVERRRRQERATEAARRQQQQQQLVAMPSYVTNDYLDEIERLTGSRAFVSESEIADAAPRRLIEARAIAYGVPVDAEATTSSIIGAIFERVRAGIPPTVLRDMPTAEIVETIAADAAERINANIDAMVDSVAVEERVERRVNDSGEERGEAREIETERARLAIAPVAIEMALEAGEIEPDAAAEIIDAIEDRAVATDVADETAMIIASTPLADEEEESVGTPLADEPMEQAMIYNVMATPSPRHARQSTLEEPMEELIIGDVAGPIAAARTPATQFESEAVLDAPERDVPFYTDIADALSNIYKTTIDIDDMMKLQTIIDRSLGLAR
jgi:hypothetical protein